jgi:hypothetical protein
MIYYVIIYYILYLNIANFLPEVAFPPGKARFL